MEYLAAKSKKKNLKRKMKAQEIRKPRRAVASPAAGPSLKEVVEKVPLTSLPSTKETILVSDDLSWCIEDEDYDIRISYCSSAAQDAPAAPDVVMLESSNDDVVILH